MICAIFSQIAKRFLWHRSAGDYVFKVGMDVGSCAQVMMRYVRWNVKGGGGATFEFSDWIVILRR